MREIRHTKFETNSIPVSERLSALEGFLKGANRGTLGDCHQLLYQPLDSGNANHTRFERMDVDNLAFASTQTSGFIKHADPNVRHTCVVVSLLNKGETDVRTPRGTQSFKEGDLSITTADWQSQIIVNESETLRIMLPLSDFVDLPVSPEGQVFFRSSNPLAGIFRTIFQKLNANLKDGELAYIRPMLQITKEMVRAALVEEHNAVYRDGYTLLRARARHFIEDNIASPHFDVADVAEHVFASRATLYRAFKEYGGVREFINQTRLDAARQMLETQMPSRGHIFNVAYACGFRSQHHFGRAFKKRFDHTPSVFVQRLAPDKRGNDQTRMAS